MVRRAETLSEFLGHLLKILLQLHALAQLELRTHVLQHLLHVLAVQLHGLVHLLRVDFDVDEAVLDGLDGVLEVVYDLHDLHVFVLVLLV